MITFFTIPKPFHGHSAIIQSNAILSWQLLKPKCEILIFGEDSSVKKFSYNNNIQCIDNFNSNEFGTPLLDKIWLYTKSSAKNDIICFINSDIILLPDFVKKIKTIKLKNYFIAGRRWDIDIEKRIEFSSNWDKKLLELIKNSAVLHSATGSDYFLFTRLIMPSMPPFAIGRGCWDNWLFYYFKKNNIPIIDGTEITTIHQNHDYSHVKSITKNSTNKGIERDTNNKIANLSYINDMNIDDARLIWSNNNIIKKKINKIIYRLIERYIFSSLSIIKKRILNK